MKMKYMLMFPILLFCICSYTFATPLSVTGEVDPIATIELAKTPKIIYQKYVNSSMTGTTQTTLDSFTIPGGIMGTNSAIEIYAEFVFNDTSGQKAIKCDFGGYDIFYHNAIPSSTVGFEGSSVIGNKGTTTSQWYKMIWRTWGNNQYAASLVTSNTTINTANNIPVEIKAYNQPPATGTITLVYVRATLYP
jgi:hypothetical protein